MTDTDQELESSVGVAMDGGLSLWKKEVKEL